MIDSIKLYGIRTNNLKNIDVTILKNSITAITGISGGGKSSLAHDTIYALCQQEFSAIADGYFEDARYLLDRYDGIAPAVSIRQINRNVNPRSTIYSYYNFFSILGSLVRSSKTNFEYSDLRLNKPGNECEQCRGTGVLHTIDEHKVVDPGSILADNPFIPWRSNSSNRYSKLLEAYCISKKLDISKKFGNLPSKAMHDLMYAESDSEFLVKFKHNGRYRQRMMSYIGPMAELQKYLTSGKSSEKNLAEKYSSEVQCPSCRGSRVSAQKYESLNIYGIPMLEFFSIEINSILARLEKIHAKDPAFTKLRTILRSISKLGLGYLNLSRSIPTLSGGELQKLNFCRLLMSEMSGIVVVIDEISSQVHVSDYLMLFDEIEKIRCLGNTIIMVEHNSYFIARSDHVIEIGPAAGRFGGELVAYERHTHTIPQSKLQKTFLTMKMPPVWRNNVKGLTLDIFVGGINVICGKSGAGKSSIAEFLAENLNNVLYISQSYIRGHVRSSVASYLDLNEILSKQYAVHFAMESNMFSPSSGKPGSCAICGGTGVLRQARDYDRTVDVTCEACNGRLFAQSIDKYKISNLSIAELYDLPFDQVLIESDYLPKKFLASLDMLCSLRLGHLSLNRKTSSLSGGELRRLKLLKYLSRRRTNKILIVDEPGAGLDDATCEDLMKYLECFKENYQSIILLDHKPSIFLHSDRIIEIERSADDHNSKVIYSGAPEPYYRNRYIPYLKYRSEIVI